MTSDGLLKSFLFYLTITFSRKTQSDEMSTLDGLTKQYFTALYAKRVTIIE